MSCRAQIAAFVLGILYTLLLVPLVKRLAVACRALDKPNARKVHKDPIPLWGGLGIAGGYFLAMATVIALSSAFRQAVTETMVSQLIGMSLGGFLILIVVLMAKPAGILGKNVGEKV